jgi:hypothetical protein
VFFEKNLHLLQFGILRRSPPPFPLLYHSADDHACQPPQNNLASSALLTSAHFQLPIYTFIL